MSIPLVSVVGPAAARRLADQNFQLTGKREKITLTIDRPKLSPESIKKPGATQRNNRAGE